MTKKSLLITATALAFSLTFVSSAMAQSKLNKTQTNLAAAIADANVSLNQTGSAVSSKVDVTAAAIGNSASMNLSRAAIIDNEQRNEGDISAALSFSAHNGIKDVTATAAAIANSANFKIESSDHEVTNINSWQRRAPWADRLTTTEAYLHSNVDGVSGSLSQTSVAIGNSFGADIKGPLGTLYNYQVYNGDIRAKTDTQIRNVTGDVTTTTAAICNSVSITARSAATFATENNQQCNIDPTATTTAVLENVVGKTNLTTAAIGNSYSLTTLPSASPIVNNVQQNNAYNGATANLTLRNIAGEISVTTAAIGNSFTMGALN
jgi:hypothetical protein